MKIFQILFLFSLLTLCVHGVAYGEEMYSERGHFKITIPPGWEIIPNQELLKFEEEIKAVHNETVDYDLALQKINRIGWFIQPYILIEIDNKGRQYSERQISGGLKKSNIKKNIKIKKNQYSKIIFNLNDNDVWYDEERNIIYTKLSIIKDGEKIEALLAQILTNFGAIRVMFYDFSNMYSNNLQTMIEVVNSINVDSDKKFDKAVKNKARGLDNAIATMVVATILSIGIAVFKKKKL